MKIQITSGGVYEVEKHPLSGKKVKTRYFGEATVVGIRANARNARERFAFVIRHGKTSALISRVNFTVLLDGANVSPRT